MELTSVSARRHCPLSPLMTRLVLSMSMDEGGNGWQREGGCGGVELTVVCAPRPHPHLSETPPLPFDPSSNLCTLSDHTWSRQSLREGLFFPHEPWDRNSSDASECSYLDGDGGARCPPALLSPPGITAGIAACVRASVSVQHYACVWESWDPVTMRGGHQQRGCGCQHLFRKLLSTCGCCFVRVGGMWMLCSSADGSCFLILEEVHFGFSSLQKCPQWPCAVWGRGATHWADFSIKVGTWV